MKEGGKMKTLFTSILREDCCLWPMLDLIREIRILGDEFGWWRGLTVVCGIGMGRSFSFCLNRRLIWMGERERERCGVCSSLCVCVF